MDKQSMVILFFFFNLTVAAVSKSDYAGRTIIKIQWWEHKNSHTEAEGPYDPLNPVSDNITEDVFREEYA